MDQIPSSSAAQPTEQKSPETPQPPSTATPPAPPLSTDHTATPTPTLKPPTITPQSQTTRPPFNTRPWQQQPYSHFSLPSPPLPSSSSSPGGIAIGVPAPSPPPPPPASFSSLAPPSYGTQQSQIRQPMQGIGMASSIRPGGVSLNQLRPSHSSLRPQSGPTSQSPSSQNFQGQGMLRMSTLGSSNSPSPSSSQNPHAQNQPWLSSGNQGKPPLPTPTLRPQTSSQSFQQRSHISQQHHHNTPATTQQQSITSSQQLPQTSGSGQLQENYGQQFPPSRIQHQQQITRGPGVGSQRPPLGTSQSSPFHSGPPSKTPIVENEESSTRIVTKRSIQDIVNQIDPSEKLDPEVEDILADIAEDFVESITTFGCSLAKHRKSSILEAKDILLHLERNWNMTLPGFGGDEIKLYKKPFVSDVHRERLAAIRKSSVATDTTTKNQGGPSAGNAKGHMAKGPANIIGSPT
ncbi:hypothetical protein ACJIZ3_021813 [Penstemon smallii]|uniref:Transcription initiation factor TFIID subunit 12 domain-containing protein n=1 Tax=Penstemon smallii TaxID=265156 RepID=A0ABD3SMI0_9LAMI